MFLLRREYISVGRSDLEEMLIRDVRRMLKGSEIPLLLYYPENGNAVGKVTISDEIEDTLRIAFIDATREGKTCTIGNLLKGQNFSLTLKFRSPYKNIEDKYGLPCCNFPELDLHAGVPVDAETKKPAEDVINTFYLYGKMLSPVVPVLDMRRARVYSLKGKRIDERITENLISVILKRKDKGQKYFANVRLKYEPIGEMEMVFRIEFPLKVYVHEREIILYVFEPAVIQYNRRNGELEVEERIEDGFSAPFRIRSKPFVTGAEYMLEAKGKRRIEVKTYISGNVCVSVNGEGKKKVETAGVGRESFIEEMRASLFSILPVVYSVADTGRKGEAICREKVITDGGECIRNSTFRVEVSFTTLREKVMTFITKGGVWFPAVPVKHYVPVLRPQQEEGKFVLVRKGNIKRYGICFPASSILIIFGDSEDIALEGSWIKAF